MSLAFADSPCPIPPIPRIPDGPMLSDSLVPAAPAAIPDCLGTLTPLLPDAPCPQITAAGTLTVAGAAVPGGMTFTATPGTCCDFDLNLAVAVPEGCPTLSVAAPGGRAVTMTAGTGQAVLSIAPGGGCAFDLDLMVSTHCPQVTVGGGTTKTVVLYHGSASAGRLTFTVTPTGECDYDLDFSGSLDIPCAALTVGGAQEHTYSIGFVSASVGYLTVRITPGPDCSFDIAVSGAMPCVGLEGDYPAYVSTADFGRERASLEVSHRTGGAGCAFDFTPTVHFPPVVLLGFTQSGGIGGMITVAGRWKPGSGLVDLYRFDGTYLTYWRTITAFNNLLGSVAGSVAVQIVNAYGYPFVGAEDC